MSVIREDLSGTINQLIASEINKFNLAESQRQNLVQQASRLPLQTAGVFLNLLENARARRAQKSAASKARKRHNLKAGIITGAGAGLGAISGGLGAGLVAGGLTAAQGAALGAGAGALTGAAAGLGDLETAVTLSKATTNLGEDFAVNDFGARILEQARRDQAKTPDQTRSTAQPAAASQAATVAPPSATQRTITPPQVTNPGLAVPLLGPTSGVNGLDETLLRTNTEEQVTKNIDRLRGLAGLRERGQKALDGGNIEQAVQMAELFDLLDQEMRRKAA